MGKVLDYNLLEVNVEIQEQIVPLGSINMMGHKYQVFEFHEKWHEISPFSCREHWSNDLENFQNIFQHLKKAHKMKHFCFLHQEEIPHG